MRMKRGAWLLLVIWCAVVVGGGVVFSKNIFQMTNLDLYYLNTTRGYVENQTVARASYNKITFYLNHYLDNFFAGIDINYFFFGGHPREVPGGNNDFKINYWLIYLFLFGVYDQFLNRETRIVALYFITLLVVSWFSIDALWFLLVPFVYLTVLYPIRALWKK